MEPSKPVPGLKLLPPLLLALLLVWAYLNTMAPGLTWANDGADGGDLITAAANGGVAHPTGYPLYLLLARFFQSMPAGTLAWRTNLMSAAFAAAAALLTYALVRREVDQAGMGSGWMAGLAAGVAAGLMPLLWSQAVITEVHVLQACLVALVFYLSAGSWPERAQKPLDCLRGLVLGLGMGNHVTLLLLVPVVILASSIRAVSPGQKWRLVWGAIARQLFFFLLGCGVYLLVPVWAASGSPVNWGGAVTPQRLWWLVSGRLYQDQLLSVSLQEAWHRLGATAGLLLEQFGPLGVVLGAAGLVFFLRKSPLRPVTLWAFAVFLAFGIGFGSFDSYLYLLPAFLAFAVWIGLGTGGLLDLIRQDSPVLARVALIVILAFFGMLGAVHFPTVDASKDTSAERFAQGVLQAAPPGALIFAEGDRAVFSLWYFHFALGERPDLIVVASDLLGYDWYQETLAAVYPKLHVPGPPLLPEALAAANPALAVCHANEAQASPFQCRAQ